MEYFWAYHGGEGFCAKKLQDLATITSWDCDNMPENLRIKLERPGPNRGKNNAR